MLKGKTIESVLSNIDSYGIRNNTISSAPSSLKPKLISNECPGVEPIFNTPSPLKPKKVIGTVTELEFEKTVIQTIRPEETVIISRTQNIRYSQEELKSRFPGYSTLYYSEIYDLLQTTDYNLSVENLNLNLQKFVNLGNTIQSQISRLHSNLELLSTNSFKTIKEKSSESIGFFATDANIQTVFIEFNNSTREYSLILYKELEDLKSIDFSKYNLLDLYKDFFIFIWDELKSKFNCSDLSIIESRVLSLNNSKIVLEQFKNLIKIEIQGKEIEYNNVKNYLDTLSSSLFLLKKQNFKEFKEQFKNFIKS
jgi:hypothetical protein